MLGEILLNADAAVPESPLLMESYISQVNSENREVKASQQASEGAKLRTSESTLFYSPIFSAEYQHLDENMTNSLFPSAYDQFKTDTYTFGISQLTPFGLKAKLGYTLEAFDYTQTPVRPKFYEGMPKIELSQSLLRNGFGSETRAQNNAIEAGADIARFSESFKAKSIRAEAEGAYIKLASTRELRKISEDSVKYAKEILEWSSRRVKLNLGEDSDLLQAQANMEARNLQLQSAIDAERSASRDFNRLRTIDGDVVYESLTLPPVNSEIPARAQLRDDVQVAMAQTRSKHAAAVIGKNKNLPTLEVYGSYALNSREAQSGTAFSNSLNSTRPTSVIGIRFETPILIGSQIDAVKGYGKEVTAAESLQNQALFTQEIQWKELVLKLDEAKRRYAIALKLSEIQKRKATSERSRLKRGRTTTYQTLLFDTDLNQAEATKIQSQSEILQIIAQMKIFGGA